MELQEISAIPTTNPKTAKKGNHHRRISSIYLQELRDLCKKTMTDPSPTKMNRTVEALASPSQRRLRFIPG